MAEQHPVLLVPVPAAIPPAPAAPAAPAAPLVVQPVQAAQAAQVPNLEVNTWLVF